jgi:uncharacterized protein (DUF1778 family)
MGKPKKKKAKVGGNKLAVRIDLRTSAEEKEVFEGAAQLSGMGLSVWIRQKLREAARTEMVKAGLQEPFQG